MHEDYTQRNDYFNYGESNYDGEFYANYYAPNESEADSEMNEPTPVNYLTPLKEVNPNLLTTDPKTSHKFNIGGRQKGPTEIPIINAPEMNPDPPTRIITPSFIDPKLITMLQEQFLIAHDKLETDNKKERQLLVNEIEKLKNELLEKQKNFEKASFELRQKNLEKIQPLNNNITMNRLNTRTVIVPIVTNGTVCRLDEKESYDPFYEGFDEEHHPSEIMDRESFGENFRKIS